MRRKKRHLAQQWELPLLEERTESPLELPARRSLLRITGSTGAGVNGVWRVASAMRLPRGGIFLGLETPTFRTSRVSAPNALAQTELFA